jgi:hypothetical protein
MRKALSFAACLLHVFIVSACGDDGTSTPDADASADGGLDGARDGGGPDGAVSDTSVSDVGTSDTGEPVTGDRWVSPSGTDSGDCSGEPCRTFDYAGSQMASGETLIVMDGTYPDAIETDTFPRGNAETFTRVYAEHTGSATVNGGLTLYDDGDFFLEIAGLRFVDPRTKGVAGGNVRLLRDSFVGGPETGNNVSFGVGTNDFYPGAWDILCEDCLFYGEGGRYAAMAYRSTRVTFRRIVARKDGGWGIGSSSATEFEPEGVVVFYESSDTLCDQCVVLDSLKLSHDSAEGLGAIIHNSHDDTYSTGCEVRRSIAIDNDYSGFTFEGNGRVNDARVTESYSAGNAGNGATLNLNEGGTVGFTHSTIVGNDGDGIADYSSVNVTISECDVSGNGGEQLRGVSGDSGGPGAGAIDLSAFDGDRIRRELCEEVSRGFCAGAMPFADYVSSRLTP